MCRSIKTLRRADSPASDREIQEAALQFVRKVSGYRLPSRANAAAFTTAVTEVGAASRRLLDALASPGQTRHATTLGVTRLKPLPVPPREGEGVLSRVNPRRLRGDGR